jgi:2'-5' RNA ligase
MIRLFVALPLPQDVRERLSGLSGGLPGVRWIAPENLHVTLRFIGDVDEGVADDLHDALIGVRAPAFDITLGGIGTFGPERRPHALWVGVDRSPALTHLRDKVESALVRAGLEPEARRFTPHVSLARLKDSPGPRLAKFMAGGGGLRIGPIACDHFVLFSSHLGRNGASYTAEAEYPLDARESGLPGSPTGVL